MRPEAIRLAGDAPEEANRLKGCVSSRRFLGEVVELIVELEDGTRLIARCPEDQATHAVPGEPILLWWPVGATTIVPD